MRNESMELMAPGDQDCRLQIIHPGRYESYRAEIKPHALEIARPPPCRRRIMIAIARAAEKVDAPELIGSRVYWVCALRSMLCVLCAAYREKPFAGCSRLREEPRNAIHTVTITRRKVVRLFGRAAWPARRIVV